jgi:hypothetical protein
MIHWLAYRASNPSQSLDKKFTSLNLGYGKNCPNEKIKIKMILLPGFTVVLFNKVG